jgi:hypothetical protein
MSLCYPELFWGLEVVADTRLCFPDILAGLHQNKTIVDSCFQKGSKMYESTKEYLIHISLYFMIYLRFN